MVEETLKHPVFFGRKVSAETRAVSYETSYQTPDQKKIFKFSKISSTGNQEAYQKMNLAEQKKKEVYRKINKMLNGY